MHLMGGTIIGDSFVGVHFLFDIHLHLYLVLLTFTFPFLPAYLSSI